MRNEKTINRTRKTVKDTIKENPRNLAENKANENEIKRANGNELLKNFILTN
ncbi:MAG: hypothetical protein NDF54_03595 [archaeon GB-1867-035]|nr:hypothetical protein [Candidatus Culexmicrobium profundum]